MIAAFTKRVLDLLQREFPTRGFRLGDEMGVITDGTAQFGVSNLLAQYEQTSMSDDEFDQAIIENFTKALKLIDGVDHAIPETWEEAKDRLRVQLVSARMVDLGKAITFPFADDVHTSLVSDCDSGYAYISNEDLERWGQTAIDALEVGKQNVLLAQESLPLNVMEGATHLLAIQTGDGYDAARILVQEIREAIIENVTDGQGEEAYVGVPNRDFLIAWPTTADDSLHQQLCETVRLDATRQSHPLSERVFRVTAETIEPVL